MTVLQNTPVRKERPETRHFFLPAEDIERELREDVLNTPDDPGPDCPCVWCGTYHETGECFG